MPRKKLTAEDMLELDIKAMLRGALHRLRGAGRLGELLGDLADKETEGGMPTAVPDSIRAGVLKELARCLGQYGEGGSASNLADDEALNARLAMLEANQPPEDQREPFDDDDDPD